VDIAPSRAQDLSVVQSFLAERNAARVARRGELVDALEHPAMLAWSDGRLVGVASYVVDRDDCELLTLYAEVGLSGIGSQLVAAVRQVAREAGCSRLWLVTTNDNLDALRFYQRRGFRLAALRPGAVDDSRARWKPEIPATGAHGIPLRDELELETSLLE
jgi:GNAT superfamily N-acetyltransferase